VRGEESREQGAGSGEEGGRKAQGEESGEQGAGKGAGSREQGAGSGEEGAGGRKVTVNKSTALRPVVS
jgi:hypothetical protein